MSHTARAEAPAGGSYVNLYGIVGTYIGTSKRSGDPASAFVEGGGGLTTSFWGMTGREDLGGGNAMIFRLESFFQPNTGAQGRKPGDPFFSRNAYMGFTSKFGALTLGRQTNPTYITVQDLNPFGASVVFSPIVVQSFVPAYNGVLIGDTVWDNAVQYSSPSLYGLVATGIYGVGGVAGQPGIANIGLHLNYSNGPFYAGGSIQRVRTPVSAPVSQQDAWLGGVRYKFPVVTVYAAIEGSQTYGARAASRTYELGATIPTGAFGAVMAEWARTSLDSSATSNWYRNTGALAYDYYLSKRTDVYGVCLYDKVSAKGSATTFALAVRHRF
jgi:predicted porin